MSPTSADSTSLQYTILFHHFREFLKRANGAGIDIMPLKGAHLLTSVYPPGEDRGLMADIDFLVREADWGRGLKLLEECGFRPRDHFSDESKRHEQGFYFALPGDKHFLFEIHRHLMEPRRYTIDSNGIWQRAYPSHFEGVPCMRMADEDVFCHVAWHSAIHRLITHRRTLRDLELVILGSQKNNPPAAELTEKIVQRAQEWHITRVVWLYLTQLEKRIADAESDVPSPLKSAIDRIAPPVQIRFLLKALVGTDEHPRLSRLNHRVQAALIWPLFFDHKRHLLKMIVNHPKLVSTRTKR